MSPEAQRIAIAEACGWKYDPIAAPDMKHVAIMRWIRPGNNIWQTEEVPNYLNDLNAMREAEEHSHLFKSWRDTERWLDFLELATIGRKAESRPDLSFVFRATAAQRAEAFLRTVGEWEED